MYVHCTEVLVLQFNCKVTLLNNNRNFLLLIMAMKIRGNLIFLMQLRCTANT